MEILYSVLILFGLVTAVVGLYWLLLKGNAVRQYESDNYDLKSAVKKQPVGEVRSYRYVIFFSGLLVSLMFATIMIEFPTILKEIKMKVKEMTIAEDEIMDIPITDMTPPPPPPPQQKVTTVEFIEKDDEEILEDEDLEVVLEPEEIVEDIPEPIIETEEIIEEPIEEAPLLVAEQSASFPGGTDALYKNIYGNFNYPQQDIDNGNQGMIYVKFVIEKDGSVSNVTILKGLNERLDKEAIRVVKELPNWIPGRNGGRPVRMYFNLPLKLKIK